MNAPAQKCPSPKTAGELLDMYFHETRSHLLETAATFDRIARAPGAGDALQDPRMQKLRQALALLAEPGTDHAEAFLNLFSE